MALEGYLEDLALGDILQIIGLSKKSGTLVLKCKNGDGLVCFLDGQVIRASSSFFPEGLGQLLKYHKIVTASQVEAALEYQETINYHQPLGQILAAKFQICAAEIEVVVATQIEKIIASFFSWAEGQFIFRLEELKSFGSAALNPLDFMLDKGINSQRLIDKRLNKTVIGSNGGAVSGVTDNVPVVLSHQQKQQNLDLLRGMLAELECPEFSGGIILLILRYASEIMNRAIVFDVRGNQLVGLGQFGLSNLNVTADDIVRKMRLQVDPESLFALVLHEKSAICGTLHDTLAERNLQDFLSGTPTEVFLGPLVSDGSVVALLYGDNYPDNKPIKAANTFEVFLSQAGMAMEQALQGN